MKSLVAKTLTSAALVLVTFTAAQAQDDEIQRIRPNYLPYASPAPGSLRAMSPAQRQYWAKREAIIAQEVKEEADRPRAARQESAMQWLQRQPQSTD